LKTLHAALANASERSHEYATLEHLLLALIDDPDASQVMQACGVDLGDLGDVVRQYLDQEYQSLKTQEKADPQPTAGFQRVIQRAILHVQSSGKDSDRRQRAGGAVLRTRFHAVYFLQQQDMSRLDAVSFISHGIGKGGRQVEGRNPKGTDEDQPKPEEKAEPRGEEGFRARPVLRQPQREGAGRQDRSADRARPEVERTIQILCRRSKNNPLYVGDPGVGKTAIAEGLARKIVEGEVPEVLANAVIYSLDMGACWPAPAIAAISRSA
jgi:ATP-dependent Clp protease ATP-binding subunit ClpA